MKLSRRTIVALAGLALSGLLLTSSNASHTSPATRFGLILFAATSLTTWRGETAATARPGANPRRRKPETQRRRSKT